MLGMVPGVEQTGSAAPLDKTMYEKRMAQIAALPPGPAKDQAIAELTASYADMGSAADSQRAAGVEATMADMPGGMNTAGKYGTYVAASPLEHLASGLRAYKGYKDISEADAQQELMAKQKQQALERMLRAGLGGPGLQNPLPGRTGN